MPASAAEIAAYKEEIYNQCLEDQDKIYYQHDLEALGIIPNGDANALLQVIQALVDEKCFKLFQDQNVTGYKCRSPEDVKIYGPLTDDEAMVYEYIEEAGSSGIWTKKLKSAIHLHEHVATKVFKSLEKKKLITDFKTMEHPGKTFYIKASIKPNERATGGSWYTDNELDEELIVKLAQLLEMYIGGKCTPTLSKRTKKKQMQHIEDLKAIRDKALPSDYHIEVEPEDEDLRRMTLDNDAKYPVPASFQKYATLYDCTYWIMTNEITNITLTAEDIQQLLDILCWDGRIEKVNAGETGVAYKPVRKSNDELTDGGLVNGFTEAPCGRCPVFDLCEEGGPVGPSNCQYFTQWLEF